MAGRRRFQAQRATITRDLRNLMQRMGATSLKVTHEEMGSSGVEIIFDRDGTRYVVRCDKYEHPDDNFRAAQLTIDYLYRAYETYGVTRDEVAATPFMRQAEAQRRERETFARLFLPFAPMPDDAALALPSGKRDWWDVLGVERHGATKRAIDNAYRALAKTHHPDMAGTEEERKRLNEEMKRLNEAYFAAKRAIAAA